MNDSDRCQSIRTKQKSMQWQDELVKLIKLENLAKQIPTTRGCDLARAIHSKIVDLAKSV